MTRHLVKALIAVLSASPAVAADRPPLKDAPIVWYERDRESIARPAERDPNLMGEYFEAGWGQPRERTTDPVRITRHIGSLFGGDHVPAADNINALDEVPNSTWFTNRIGLFAITPEQLATEYGGEGPDRSAPWTVVSAKTEGVTPGFIIQDATGQRYLLKFDPRGNVGQTTAAGVISGRIFHAAGYNVPDDAVVRFRREHIVLGDDVMLRLPHGEKRPMTVDDIDLILHAVDMVSAEEWLGLTSKFVDGKPLGPFSYRGRRKDDPNDRVKHENRRELRGLYVLAAWLNHFDTKQQNSLDVFVTEGGGSFVKHYLIDFASTLGASATGNNRRYGYEFTFDVAAMLGRTFTLGFREDRWRKRTRNPDLIEVGYFDSEVFDPATFRPTLPNDAFANVTDRDGYWGAKIVGAFTDAHIRAIVAQGHYADPAAAEYVTRTLMRNRDLIVRYFFDRVPPLDFFMVADGQIRFQDLGARYGVYPNRQPRYRFRASTVNKERDKGRASDWGNTTSTVIPLQSGFAREAVEVDEPMHPFLALECQVDRGQGWSRSVTVYLASGGTRVVAVDR